MVKAVDEICASCGKSKPKIGSLTQWIGLSDSCRCAILAEEKSETGPSDSVESSKTSEISNGSSPTKRAKRPKGCDLPGMWKTLETEHRIAHTMGFPTR